ncbi:hypothetical protein F511_17935 [Dorcoceras hygrometricum]|uniref:Uncharacterized protein n=1 Tax=Dorcoceras hygrometricum TaxID=472368 RepID=A0A2Z7AZ33_9LAMI|nr:hypothetical protein F511_17935 [Dorcoceras hygrometricum]
MNPRIIKMRICGPMDFGVLHVVRRVAESLYSPSSLGSRNEGGDTKTVVDNHRARLRRIAQVEEDLISLECTWYEVNASTLSRHDGQGRNDEDHEGEKSKDEGSSDAVAPSGLGKGKRKALPVVEENSQKCKGKLLFREVPTVEEERNSLMRAPLEERPATAILEALHFPEVLVWSGEALNRQEYDEVLLNRRSMDGVLSHHDQLMKKFKALSRRKDEEKQHNLLELEAIRSRDSVARGGPQFEVRGEDRREALKGEFYEVSRVRKSCADLIGLGANESWAYGAELVGLCAIEIWAYGAEMVELYTNKSWAYGAELVGLYSNGCWAYGTELVGLCQQELVLWCRAGRTLCQRVLVLWCEAGRTLCQ